MVNYFMTKVKNIQWEMNELFNKLYRHNWFFHMKEWNWTSVLYLTQKSPLNGSQTWMQDWNHKTRINHVVCKLLDIGLGNYLFIFDTKCKGNKSKNQQVGLHQAKLLHSKEATNILKSNLWNGGNIFKHIFSKGLLLKTYKEL